MVQCDHRLLGRPARQRGLCQALSTPKTETCKGPGAASPPPPPPRRLQRRSKIRRGALPSRKSKHRMILTRLSVPSVPVRPIENLSKFFFASFPFLFAYSAYSFDLWILRILTIVHIVKNNQFISLNQFPDTYCQE